MMRGTKGDAIRATIVAAQKPPNRAVIAVARELVGFIWAVLQQPTQDRAA